MIIVCGEALIDLIEATPRTFAAYPGGSPANVAVGLSRLGVPTGLLARISTAPLGALLRAHLSASGVDESYLVAASEPVTLALACLDASGAASYDFYVAGTADWCWTPAELPERFPAEVTALHSGSMVLEAAPGAAVIEDLLRREHLRGDRTISYDPNVRLARSGPRSAALERCERLVGLADIVKVSAEDLDWLLPGESPAALAQRWLGLGPGLVVVTLGADGALAACAAGLLRVPARPVTVVDTVGAGDAFTAGLLARLDEIGALGSRPRERLGALTEAMVSEALRVAAAAAAAACARAGADPPDAARLREWLAR